jgi:hypothetical protein
MPALLAFLLLCLPLITLAQEFVPLVGIPFIDNVDVGGTASTRLSAYASAFYIAAISLGAVVAVLKIIFAGVKYMLSDVITDKSQAKTDIKGALLGLILIIGAVLMLNTISPNITALQAFNLRALDIQRPEMVPLDEVLEEAVTEMCDETVEGNFCVRESCWFQCEDWCRNEKNGVYIPSTSNSYPICVYTGDGTEGELVGTEVIGTIACEISDPGIQTRGGSRAPTYDCTSAIAQCETQGGTDTIDQGANIQCTKEVSDPNYNLSEQVATCTDVPGSNQTQCGPLRELCEERNGEPENIERTTGRGSTVIGVRCRFD